MRRATSAITGKGKLIAPDAPNALLAAALEYTRTWAVLPCVPGGKAPVGGIVPRGLKDATSDEATIQAWWDAEPEANVAVAAGRSGLIIVDCDGAEGIGSFISWCEANDIELGDVPYVATPRGGRHYYFAAPDDASVGPRVRCLPGVDIRAGESYVVAPPSRWADGGCWEWGLLPYDVPYAPEAVVALAAQEAATAPQTATERRIPEGERDVTLTALAGAMRRRGATEEAILAALRAENERCAPPLGEKDLRRIARSVARYAPEDKQYSLTDGGNAEYFADEYAQRVCFNHRRQLWLVWDGTIWKPDDDGALIRYALEAAKKRGVAAIMENGE